MAMAASSRLLGIAPGMSYRQMRYYADTLPVHVASRKLPDGIDGIYSDRYKSIIIDYRLPYAAKRVTFAHELTHFTYADDKCHPVLQSRNEIRTRKATALALVDIVQYAALEQEYDGDLFKVAEDLEVTVGLLRDFQEYVLCK